MNIRRLNTYQLYFAIYLAILPIILPFAPMQDRYLSLTTSAWVIHFVLLGSIILARVLSTPAFGGVVLNGIILGFAVIILRKSLQLYSENENVHTNIYRLVTSLALVSLLAIIVLSGLIIYSIEVNKPSNSKQLASSDDPLGIRNRGK